MKSYSISNLSFSYGSLKIFDNLNLELEKTSVTALLGPSGSGKTTLLDILAGIRKPSGGSIGAFGRASVSYCFQEPRLLPWRTAEANLLYALSGLTGSPGKPGLAREYLRLAGLEGFENYYPHQLSGGMQRRLALARAFAYPSEILLLDEAFSSVDLRLRIELMETFLALWDREKRTTVFVTHEVRDALFLADRILILKGRPAALIDSIGIDRTAGKNPRSYADASLSPLEERILDRILSRN